jgi:hypothetical protein
MSSIEYISHHPSVAFCVGLLHLITIEFLGAFQLPLILMQTLQAGAWTITICVGLISMYGSYKRWRNK